MCITGCNLVGPNPRAPYPAEKIVFDTTTNYVPVTNFVAEVSKVAKTNTDGTISLVSVTNVIPQVGLQPIYTETVKPGVGAVATGVGSVINTFFPGVGAVAVQGLLALLGGWAFVRSNKQRDTSGALAQEIQVILNFIGQLPNGPSYVETLKDFMQKHQNDAEVVNQVLTLLAQEVSNTDAKVAANQIINTINGLKSVTSPVDQIKT